jgi:hypothetical protein
LTPLIRAIAHISVHTVRIGGQVFRVPKFETHHVPNLTLTSAALARLIRGKQQPFSSADERVARPFLLSSSEFQTPFKKTQGQFAGKNFDGVEAARMSRPRAVAASLR